METKDLADSVNGMAESLDRLEQSRKSFVANVSHELKTPITIIGGYIDGILDGTIPPAEQPKYMQVVSEETKRMSLLVVDMLNMAKIEAGQLKLSYSDAKKNVSVSIRNTGKGIPEEERVLVFDRFYKLDKSRGSDSRSFGIGLSIAKRIVEMHHGSISINSREKEYTEFVVTLPVQPDAT